MSEETEYYTLTKKAFSFLAPCYNLLTVPLIKVREKVVSMTGARENATVLDVATGTGQQAFAYAKRGYVVRAIDITESMLAVARKNNKNGLVNFESGDATYLRFKDNTFGVTCISFALHDMPPTIGEKVLREMVRVTTPGGAILIVDYALPNNKLGKWLVYRLITLYEGKYYKQFIASDLKGLARSLGIETVEACSILLGAGTILKGKKTRNH